MINTKNNRNHLRKN